jgi:hypothetical protein
MLETVGQLRAGGNRRHLNSGVLPLWDRRGFALIFRA